MKRPVRRRDLQLMTQLEREVHGRRPRRGALAATRPTLLELDLRWIEYRARAHTGEGILTLIRKAVA